MFIELNTHLGETTMHNISTIVKVKLVKDGRAHVYFDNGRDNFFENKYEDLKRLLCPSTEKEPTTAQRLMNHLDMNGKAHYDLIKAHTAQLNALREQVESFGEGESCE